MKSLLQAYVAFTGAIAAYTIGLIDRYSLEHRRFLSSGFICGGCRGFLIKKTLIADVQIMDANGGEVPMFMARSRGKYFKCPRCGHQWEFRQAKAA